MTRVQHYQAMFQFHKFLLLQTLCPKYRQYAYNISMYIYVYIYLIETTYLIETSGISAILPASKLLETDSLNDTNPVLGGDKLPTSTGARQIFANCTIMTRFRFFQSLRGLIHMSN